MRKQPRTLIRYPFFRSYGYSILCSLQIVSLGTTTKLCKTSPLQDGTSLKIDNQGRSSIRKMIAINEMLRYCAQISYKSTVFENLRKCLIQHFNNASEASYVYNFEWTKVHYAKNAKNGQFGKFLKPFKKCYQTGHF